MDIGCFLGSLVAPFERVRFSAVDLILSLYLGFETVEETTCEAHDRGYIPVSASHDSNRNSAFGDVQFSNFTRNLYF